MSDITRLEKSARMSQSVSYGNLVWLAGQVGTADTSVTDQTRDILARIDTLLAASGSDKSRLLQAIIWLADMADFAEMNAVWDAWVDPRNPPARACGEARLAAPGFTVEIIVVAAMS